jgi:integrase
MIADHARLYAMIGLYTTARPSAILELTWDRVDFLRGIIDFTPPGHVRTAKRRTIVPIAADLRPELAKGFEARTCQHVIERGGKPVACIKKAFQAASERSGVHATPYTLRHTGAVYAAEGGVSMAELAQFMGHDDDRTTQRHYARFSPGHLRGVADAIGSKARGQVAGHNPCLAEAESA